MSKDLEFEPNTQPDDIFQVVNKEEVEEPKEEVLTPSHPNWEEHVLKHFKIDELTADGKPRLHGLRRLVRLLLGDIIEQHVVLENASAEFCAAVFTCTIMPHDGRDTQTYSDGADAHNANLNPTVVQYKTAVAVTRAEARTYRKALGISTVTADELNLKDSNKMAELEPDDGTKISDFQKNFLDKLCKRLNLNVDKFINRENTLDARKRRKYASVDDIPRTIFPHMQTALNDYQQGKQEIPDKLLGYIEQSGD